MIPGGRSCDRAEVRPRRGGDVICIYNEAYSPAGINPRTGTISPSVQRTLRVRNR